MSRVLMSVYAGGSSDLRTAYTDKDGAPAAPSSLSYRIINPVTGDEVRASTVVAQPAATVDLPLIPADHALATDATQERRRVIVTASYGVDDVLIGVYDYLVKATDSTAIIC
jgi:hypothetical protein